jgi:excisionase family DNA binding protein
MAKTKTKQKPEERKLLRVDQVAEILNVAKSTIYLWCDHGHLEKTKLTDGCIRITEASVNQFIEGGFVRGRY